MLIVTRLRLEEVLDGEQHLTASGLEGWLARKAGVGVGLRNAGDTNRTASVGHRGIKERAFVAGPR